MLHPDFSLEQYFVAQALDYHFLMDDDPHIISENYHIPNTAEHPLPNDTVIPISVEPNAHAS